MVKRNMVIAMLVLVIIALSAVMYARPAKSEEKYSLKPEEKYSLKSTATSHYRYNVISSGSFPSVLQNDIDKMASKGWEFVQAVHRDNGLVSLIFKQ